MQIRGRDGWTCFHHALSLPSRGNDAEAWIRAAAALPSGAALLAEAEKEVGALAADDLQLEAAAGGAGDGVQVRRGWRAEESSGLWHSSTLGMDSSCAPAVNPQTPTPDGMDSSCAPAVNPQTPTPDLESPISIFCRVLLQV
jgi:hypothetical protein